MGPSLSIPASACIDVRGSRSPEPSSLWSYTGRGRIRFLRSARRATAPDFHDRSSSIQVKRRYVSAYSSSAAPSSSFTTHQWLSTTTTSVSLYIIFTSDTIFFYKQKVHITWPIYYCRLSTVLIMIILAMLLAILLLMLPDLTSMLEICMLVYEIVMICILLLIWKLVRKLPNYSTYLQLHAWVFFSILLLSWS